jgi:hypothetical protein
LSWADSRCRLDNLVNFDYVCRGRAVYVDEVLRISHPDLLPGSYRPGLDSYMFGYRHHSQHVACLPASDPRPSWVRSEMYKGCETLIQYPLGTSGSSSNLNRIGIASVFCDAMSVNDDGNTVACDIER